MPILIALGLLPTLSFYFFVLVQFWKEAKRRRRQERCAAIVRLHSARAREPEYVPVAWPGPRSLSGPELAGRPAGVTHGTKYSKNGLAVLPCGPGRLALNRSAKG
jgi:hypothetical protein